jgi:hypothetical protein
MQSFSYVSFPQFAKIFPDIAGPIPPAPADWQRYLLLADIGRKVSQFRWLQHFNWGANPFPTEGRMPLPERSYACQGQKLLPAENKRLSHELPTFA